MATEIEIEDDISKNSAPHVDFNEIPYIDTSVSYNDFFQSFILENVPCIIKNIARSWECSKHWVEGNKPAFSYLDSKYGKSKATVYDCNKKYFNSQKCECILFSDFLKYWEDYINRNYHDQIPLLYLKDWHLKNEFPEDHFYEVPLYFASDWLNEYLCANDMDDYRFVYMGPKGTW